MKFALSTLIFFFSFRGRWPRETLWLGLAVLAAMFLTVVSSGPKSFDDFSGWQQVAVPLLICVVALSFFAMFARRWHDLGLSGWTTPHCFIPTFGSLSKLADAFVTPGSRDPNIYGEAVSRPVRAVAAPSGRKWLPWLLFSFHGRIGRRDFWLGLILMVAVEAALLWTGVSFSDYAKTLNGGAPVPQWGWISNILRLLLIALVLPAVAALAVSAKRWHDLGRSGLWSLVALIPVVGGLKLFLDCGLLPGERESNRYGQPAVLSQDAYEPGHGALLTGSGLVWLLFDTRGRLARSPFAITQAVLIATAVALMITVFVHIQAVGGSLEGLFEGKPASMLDHVATALLSFAIVAVFWSWLAVMSKRWHDIGRSGWETAVALVPAVGLPAVIVTAGMIKGSEGQNRYGPAPSA